MNELPQNAPLLIEDDVWRLRSPQRRPTSVLGRMTIALWVKGGGPVQSVGGQ